MVEGVIVIRVSGPVLIPRTSTWFIGPESGRLCAEKA